MVEKRQARKHMEHFNRNGETGKGRKWIWGFKSAAKSFIKPAKCQQRKNGISSHVFSASLNKVSFQALPVKAWQQNCHQRIINIFEKEVLERTSISFFITVLASRQYLGTWAFAGDPNPKNFTSLYVWITSPKEHHHFLQICEQTALVS